MTLFEKVGLSVLVFWNGIEQACSCWPAVQIQPVVTARSSNTDLLSLSLRHLPKKTPFQHVFNVVTDAVWFRRGANLDKMMVLG